MAGRKTQKRRHRVRKVNRRQKKTSHNPRRLQKKSSGGGLETGFDDDAGGHKLFMYIKNGDITKVRSEFTKDNININNNQGFTPLHYAIIYKKIDIAKVLIDKGADINKKDNSGRTPLNVAIFYNITDESLLDKLIDDNTIKMKDNYGISPLGRAMINENNTNIKYLTSEGSIIDSDENEEVSKELERKELKRKELKRKEEERKKEEKRNRMIYKSYSDNTENNSDKKLTETPTESP